jgi:hypothetical protein
LASISSSISSLPSERFCIMPGLFIEMHVLAVG